MAYEKETEAETIAIDRRTKSIIEKIRRIL